MLKHRTSHKFHDNIHIHFKWDRSVLEILITSIVVHVRKLLFSTRIMPHHNSLSLGFDPFLLSNFSISYWWFSYLSPQKNDFTSSKQRQWSFVVIGAHPSPIDVNCPLSLQGKARIWPAEINSMYRFTSVKAVHGHAKY